MASRSKQLRGKAATALRAGRKAPPGDVRDRHFDMGVSYKALAHSEEWAHGERQRSSLRGKKSKAKPSSNKRRWSDKRRSSKKP
jgi:hypothetical protein